MSKGNTVYINKETVLKSLLCDFITFAFLLFSFWFNYMFMEGNNFVDAMILFGIIPASLLHAKDNIHRGVSDEKFKQIEKILEEDNDSK